MGEDVIDKTIASYISCFLPFRFLDALWVFEEQQLHELVASCLQLSTREFCLLFLRTSGPATLLYILSDNLKQLFIRLPL